MSKYCPPEIANYPKDKDSFLSFLSAYMQEQKPADLFFEFFIIDTIGDLPTETLILIDEYFKENILTFKDKGEWRKAVKTWFRLSETIEIAILDLWYRHSEKAKSDGWHYLPWHFAMNFIDEYFKEGSRIDFWPGNSYQEALARIAKYKKMN